MLSEKDKAFIQRWETVREKESSVKHKLLSGLPMAMLFALPVLLFFVIVKIFFPSWFATATHRQTEVVVPGLTQDHMQLSAGNMAMAFIAVLVVVLFFAYFRMHYKWENNEQLYRELKSKEKK
jgi:membrane protein implicated in regulation of membrane protease activity